MKRTIVSCAAAVAMFLILAAPSCYDPANDGYHIVWQDEFDGSSLDMTTWSDHMPWFSAPPAGLVTVSDGQLHLVDRAGDASEITEVTTLGPRSASAPYYPNAQTWTGGGYFEARIRYTSETNNWPAFWLFGQALAQVWQPGGSGHAACPQLQTEWDIVDNFGPAADEWIYATNDNTNERCQTDDHPVVQPVSTGQDLSQWHTFAGRWQDGQLCHYLDNTEVGCLPVPSTFGDPMFLILTTRIGCFGGGCDGVTPAQVSMDVDWVRVWQR